jgi:FxsC-like protein
MSYYFFFSYAHEDNLPDSNGKRWVKKFYDDLSNEVSRKASLPANEVSFFDEEAIRLGTKWPGELFEGIQTAKIFVCLYSPTYFKKPFCGKEWTIFNHRRQAYAQKYGVKEPELIIPVLWEKEIYVSRNLPAPLKEDQYTFGDFGYNYPLYGLRQIISQPNLRETLYKEFLDKFSDLLIEAVKPLEAAKPPRELPRFETDLQLDQIEPLFPASDADAGAAPDAESEDANPLHVRFAFVVGRQKEMLEEQIRERLEYYRGSGAEWTPYLPHKVERRIDLLVQEIASKRDFSRADDIKLDNTLLTNLEKAKKNNQIVVIVVDSWTLKIPKYRELMSSFDEKSFLNCVVVILWIDDEETAGNRTKLEQFVRAAFPTLRLRKGLLDCEGPVKKLETRLGKTLCDTKENILQIAEIQRAIGNDRPGGRPLLSVA